MIRFHHTRNRLFYSIKPFLPRFFQIAIRRQIAGYIRRMNNTKWPIDPKAGFKPEGWGGWPKGKKFALVLSHDVDTIKGYNNALKLAALEKKLGFQSIFNFVPERYGKISPSLINQLRQDGFEIGLHGLKHDGKLFSTKTIFNRRAPRLNAYLKEWQTDWFTSPSMHRNLYWLTALNIKYAVSTFDTDPFEPQPDGVKTIFPFWVNNPETNKGYLELPYTLPQDSTLFIILKEKTNQIWKTKLDWIAKHGGVALLNTHPDYMSFYSNKARLPQYPVDLYTEFLNYIKNRYADQYFHSTPSSVADYFLQHSLHDRKSDNNISIGRISPFMISSHREAQVIHSNTKRNSTSSSISCGESGMAHILFIVENNNVPTDIRVWREAKTARHAGYDVSIIAPKDSCYSKSFETIDGIRIYRHITPSSPDGISGKCIEYLNAFFWETYLALKLYKAKPFQIIHAANPPDNIFLIALFFKLLRVRFIFDHHDISPELFSSKFGKSNSLLFFVLRLFEKLSCKIADHVISTNRSYRDHVTRLHAMKSDKISIVRNDPEPDMFPEPNPQKSSECIKLIYVGSINSQDGVDDIIRAIHCLIFDLGQKNIYCTIVGDGESLDEIKSLAKNLFVQEYIQFTGYVYDRDRIKQYVSDADICLESAPANDANTKSTFIKIMEYMACGKPIVAYDLAETRFSVGSGAILVLPGDYIAFSEAIKKLIDDPIRRQTLGTIARKRIIEELNWNSSARILLHAYDKVLGN
jgi:glycosyltransferase involved in cell wall biosynthesis/peptidoglycan/xylan/chitin deacetylase (PgdA/CDA1 family)